MARNIGDTLLQAADQISRQLQTQSQMRLQMMQFGEQIRAAEERQRLADENLQLREKSLSIQEKNAQVALRNAQVGERRATLAEEQAPVELEIQKLQQARIQAETELTKERTKQLGLGGLREGKVDARNNAERTLEFIQFELAKNPDRLYEGLGIPPAELATFGRMTPNQLESQSKHLSAEISRFRNSTQMLLPDGETRLKEMRDQQIRLINMRSRFQEEEQKIQENKDSPEFQRSFSRAMGVSSASINAMKAADAVVAAQEDVDNVSLVEKEAIITAGVEENQRAISNLKSMYTTSVPPTGDPAFDSLVEMMDASIGATQNNAELAQKLDFFRKAALQANPQFDTEAFVPVFRALIERRGGSLQGGR